MVGAATRSRLKGLWLRLASLAVGGALSSALLCGLVAGYLGYCRSTGTDARLLRPYPALCRLLADEDYLALRRLVTAEGPDTFATVWDSTDAIMLSRAEFVPTEMYGHAKFRYRPGLRYLDAELWTGVDRQRLSALDAPEIRAAVERCRVFRRIAIETDDLGFKKTAFPREAGAPVILFVGDSFTEGLDVASPDTFVSLFGGRLRAAGLPGVPVNAGVNGYGPLEECWTVEHFATQLGARVVVANLFPNDVQADFPAVVAGARVPEALWGEMFGYLDRLADFCQAKGLALLVAAIPAREQLSLTPGESPFDRRVAAWCRARGLPFLSPLAVFRAQGAGTVYFPSDPHLSEAGHSIYAQFLFERSLPLLRRALQ